MQIYTELKSPVSNRTKPARNCNGTWNIYYIDSPGSRKSIKSYVFIAILPHLHCNLSVATKTIDWWKFNFMGKDATEIHLTKLLSHWDVLLKVNKLQCRKIVIKEQADKNNANRAILQELKNRKSPSIDDITIIMLKRPKKSQNLFEKIDKRSYSHETENQKVNRVLGILKR